MKFSTALLALFVVASLSQALPLDEPLNTWEKFKHAFNKSYSSAEEEAIRKANFEKSLAWVRENHGKHGNITFGINELSDMSKEEFFSLNGVPKSRGDEFYNGFYHLNVDPDLPQSIDYRRYFGPAQNQMQCGSCWSFAATAVIEGLVRMKHGEQLKLSEQQLVDCTDHDYYPAYQNLACRGGFISEGFHFVHDHGQTESRFYPYTARLGQCHSATRSPNVRLSNYFQLVQGASDGELMTALKNYGPIGVTIHASFEGFMYYKGNTIMNWYPNSDPRGNDHAVVLVGYGTTEQGYSYWIIRNSHSSSWGDHGYGYILRGGNYMGINNNANIAVLA